eukprot:122437_1
MAVVQQRQNAPSLAPVAGLASAIAMGVYIGYSMSKPSNFASSQQTYTYNNSNLNNNNLNTNINNSKPSIKIRNRIFKTYAYFAGSIGITGLSAYFCFNFTKYSHNTLIKMNKHPKWYLFTSLISSIGLLLATKFTNYNNRPILKHLLWIAMHINEGALLSVLGFIGGPIIIKAAIYTAAILGGISLISASASDEKILKLGAFLGIGLGFLMGMSAIQYIYPSVGKSNTFQNINIYGGLLIFGLQMAYDTKKVLIKAKQLNKEYDPINAQMDLYLNSINFFLDIIRLILKQQEEERKRQQERDNNNRRN